MDIVLKICVSDGSEILVDGFDEISFHNQLPYTDLADSGYSWRKNHDDLLNCLTKYNFIKLLRHEEKNDLEYKNHIFAFTNQNVSKNVPLTLTTNSITTIIDMYE